jgi:hypothetical protein
MPITHISIGKRRTDASRRAGRWIVYGILWVDVNNASFIQWTTMMNLGIWLLIAMITVSMKEASRSEALLTTNSDSLVLRVYDRGMDPPKSKLRQVHALKGFTNRNWPIKSSFYCGSECK